jgi:hypothetical protein
MEEEEVKGGQPFIKLRPQVHTMKACIVGMEYMIKNSEKPSNLKQLGQSYADAEKVYQLFMNTLRWHKDDVRKF